MKEWYLEHTPPESTSGYENDAISDYGEPDFTDILFTDFAKTVMLYNHDLSEFKEIKCVVQGNTSDTQLKSMERVFLFKIGTVKAGMYVFFENRYWLIDGYPGNNGSYEKATSVLCQYNLKWQNAAGKIFERWCNITSASKYDIGESGNNTIVLTSNNYAIKIPYDEETLDLEGKRVFIDKRIIKPRKVFKLTRNDDVLYDYGDNDHGSILNLIADKDELNLSVDNQDLRICDYHSSTSTQPSTPPTTSDETTVSILGNTNLKIGYPRIYTAKFTDKDGNDVKRNFKWNLVSDFDVEQTIMDNKIKLRVSNEDCIGSSFLLQILDDNDNKLAETQIEVVELM